ncbi:MAG TPA: ABC transporter ATP-binding protein [Candidatus Acidoferrum sp.]|jgi:ABC-2 type transport system ATP-binding protein
MTAPAIEFRQVSKTYRKLLGGMQVPALTNVSFEVQTGEVCAFLGPNGAGKTTSISILMGFLYANWGHIRVLGHQPGDVRAKGKIGFVPENFAFYKHLNAEKLLRFHAQLAGVQEVAAAALIPELIAKVKLNGYEKLKIGRYSRGMVQRLGIAQALLADPELLIMDEPTSGLDPAGRKEVRDVILGLKAAGKTIFLSSHLLSEVEQVCDQAVIVDRGRVVRSGAMKQLLEAGDQVEIVATGISEDIRAMLQQWGATAEHSAKSVRITVPSEHKREVVEKLWAAGHDAISLHPVKGSLEDLYMKLVGGGAA